MAGNLVPITRTNDAQLHINFQAFHENRLPFIVRIRDQDKEPTGRVAFMREHKVAKGEPPQLPLCNLQLTLPEYNEDLVSCLFKMITMVDAVRMYTIEKDSLVISIAFGPLNVLRCGYLINI